ncbi:hypothetical protein MNBD_GAMMA21-1371 [hydrothermal vent metagenome]|uniref:Lipoprotein n=1 Tax=hydrothermal vent metagenome TaxID=652676 RepID=A0A3B1AIQ1_9ZZZZ
MKKQPNHANPIRSIVLVFIFVQFSTACQSDETRGIDFVANNYGKWLSIFNADLTKFNESISSPGNNLKESICPGSKISEALHSSYLKNKSYDNKANSIIFSSNIFKVFHGSVPAARIDDISSLKLTLPPDSIAVYLLVNSSLSGFNEFASNTIPDGNKLVRDALPFAIFCQHEDKLKLHSISKELAKIAIEMTRYEINQ